jgi:hypothetical protein
MLRTWPEPFFELSCRVLSILPIKKTDEGRLENMADAKEAFPKGKRCCVVGRRSDFGLPPATEGKENGFVAYKAVSTRRGVEVDNEPVEAGSEGLPCSRDDTISAVVTVQEGVTSRISAPLDNRRKAKKVLPTVLDIKLPFSIEESVYVFLDVQSRGGQTDALSVAARIADIRQKLQALSAVGGDPTVLDHEGLALWTQSLKERPFDANEGSLRAVMHLGHGRWTVVTGAGHTYLGSYSVRSGDVKHVQRILKATEQKEREKSTDETGKGPGGKSAESAGFDLVICGWGAEQDGVIDRLGSAIESHRAALTVVEQPSIFLVRAVADRTLYDGALRCNLRIGGLEHPSVVERAMKKSWVGAALLLSTGMLLCAGNLVTGFLAFSREERVNARINEMREELAGYSIAPLKGEKAQNKVRSEVTSRIQNLRPFFINYRQKSPAEALYEITGVAAEKDIDFDALVISGDRVEIKGTAGNRRAPVSVETYLRKQGFEVVLERNETSAGDEVAFTIHSKGGG